MSQQLCFILFSILSIWHQAKAAEADLEALEECGNLHHLEFKSIPKAGAVYSNSHCQLKCMVGDRILSDDALNEGFPCPLNPTGVSCYLLYICFEFEYYQ